MSSSSSNNSTMFHPPSMPTIAFVEDGNDFPSPYPVLKTCMGNLRYSPPDFTSELQTTYNMSSTSMTTTSSSSSSSSLSMVSTRRMIVAQVDIHDVYGRDFGDLPLSTIQHINLPTANTPASTSIACAYDATCIPHSNTLILCARQKEVIGSVPGGLHVKTPGGRKVVSVDAYARRIATDKYPAVVALCDEVPLFVGVKKCSKSSERALTWAKQLRQHKAVDWSSTYLFGVTCPFSREQHLLPHHVQPPSVYLDRVEKNNPLTQRPDKTKATALASTSECTKTTATIISTSVSSSVNNNDQSQSQHRNGDDSPSASAIEAMKATAVDDTIIRQAMALLQLGCDGLVVGGAGMGETLHQLGVAIRSAKQALNDTKQQQQQQQQQHSSKETNMASTPIKMKRSLLMVPELLTIPEILTAMVLGADLISSDLPQIFTDHHLALHWDLDSYSSLDYTDDDKASRAAVSATISSSTTSASTSTGKRSAVELHTSIASASPSIASSSSQLDPFRACGAIVAIQGNDDLDTDMDPLSGNRTTTNKDDKKNIKKQKTTHIEDNITSTAGGVDAGGGGPSSTSNAQSIPVTEGMSMNVEKQADASDDIKSSSTGPSKIYVSAVERGTVLDLTEEKYVRDVRPLLAGCTCHACRHHTRAYIHHLIRAKEMLGEILMYGHNQHQLIRLFDVSRNMKKKIKQGNTTEDVMKDMGSVEKQDHVKGNEGSEVDLNPIHSRAFAQWSVSVMQQMQ